MQHTQSKVLPIFGGRGVRGWGLPAYIFLKINILLIYDIRTKKYANYEYTSINFTVIKSHRTRTQSKK